MNSSGSQWYIIAAASRVYNSRRSQWCVIAAVFSRRYVIQAGVNDILPKEYPVDDILIRARVSRWYINSSESQSTIYYCIKSWYRSLNVILQCADPTDGALFPCWYSFGGRYSISLHQWYIIIAATIRWCINITERVTSGTLLSQRHLSDILSSRQQLGDILLQQWMIYYWSGNVMLSVILLVDSANDILLKQPSVTDNIFAIVNNVVTISNIYPCGQWYIIQGVSDITAAMDDILLQQWMIDYWSNQSKIYYWTISGW